MRRFAPLLTVAALQSACGSAPANAPPARPASTATTPRIDASPPDGEARLPRDVKPVGYALRLDVDPRLDHFAGEVRIRVALGAPTRRIVLHARDLEIGEATVADANGTHAALVTHGPHAGLSLSTDVELMGNVELRLAFHGSLEQTPESLYRVHEDGRWYAYTQFESLMARQAFPCFDEPGFKTPFDVTIVAPADMLAVANTPVLDVTDAPPQGNVARRAHRFTTTKPLPTYLVALAVGELDVVDAPIGELRHRILTTRGKGAQTAYVVEQAPRILSALTDYFGTPYPFEKLDQIAVPNFNSGAMENVGLVTYRERLLLVDTDHGSERDKIASRAVMAHELAHMWFGNLVTMKWWNDTWLNESFATWMSNKVMARIAPELESDAYAVTSMLAVMGDDALGSAAPVRKTIENDGDIQNAFDWITYSKGFAVLRMLERWLGEETFRTAIREYLTEFSYANADMGDFLSVVERSTGKAIGPVVRSFVLEPGVPQVDVSLQCRDGKATANVTQKRYAPRGVTPRASQSWTFPLCLSLFGKGVERQCALVSASSQEIPLDGPCPNDVYPNADEAAYYHWSVPAESLRRLATTHRAKLSLAERIALPAHTRALFESGDVDATTLLAVLAASAKDDHRLVVEEVLTGLELIRRSLPTGEGSAELARVATKVLHRHVQRVGVSPRPREALGTTLLRHPLVSAYFRLTKNAAIERAARDAALDYVAAPDTFSDDRVKLLLPIAAQRGDAALHAALVAQLKRGVPPTREHALIVALGHFDDPELLTATFDLVLNGAIRATEYGTLVRAAAESATRYGTFWRWYRENEARLLPLLGPHVAPGMPRAATWHCSRDGKREAREQFGDLTRFGSGAQRQLEQTLEAVDRCIALRKAEGTNLVQALAAFR